MKIHFNKAYLKLTLFYVLIVMAISVSFSVVLYEISTREIQRGLRGQGVMMHDMGSVFVEDFQSFRESQVRESRLALRENLIYFNLLILLISAALSYYLAKRSLQPLEEMIESQKRFVADASHELKTPLTAMKTEIEVALRDKNKSSKDLESVLRSNVEELDKLKKLSNALLKLSQYEDGYRKSFKSLKVKGLMEDVLLALRPITREKNIKIEKSISNLTVEGDRDSLFELFYIILENAVKYSSKNSKIEISAGKSAKGVVVIIKDQGCGINSSDIPHVFDRFFRADHSRSKNKVEGYGLGLSIAKKIVEMHDGEIRVDSVPGEGSSFVVIL